jgi:hypothetical protein
MDLPVLGLEWHLETVVLYSERAIGPNICEAVDYRFLHILLEFLSRLLGSGKITLAWVHGAMRRVHVPR